MNTIIINGLMGSGKTSMALGFSLRFQENKSLRFLYNNDFSDKLDKFLTITDSLVSVPYGSTVIIDDFSYSSDKSDVFDFILKNRDNFNFIIVSQSLHLANSDFLKGCSVFHCVKGL